MGSTDVPTSRRLFLQNTTWAALTIGGLITQASGSDEPDPFASLPKSVLENARNNGLIMIHRPAPAVLSSHTSIVAQTEPGKRLIIEGQVFTPDGKTPAEGITVYAYNTDAEGYHGAHHKDYPPRLYGWMKTDVEGRFELHTILPGHYPAMRVPAHVHFTLWGSGYPPQWVDELRFEGGPYITPEMLAEAEGKREFSSIRPLTRAENGILHCQFKIRLQRETNFH